MTLLADDDLDRPGADMRPAFTASSLGDPTLGDCHRRLVPRCPPRRCHVEPHQNVRPLGRIHCLMTPSNGSRRFCSLWISGRRWMQRIGDTREWQPNASTFAELAREQLSEDW